MQKTLVILMLVTLAALAAPVNAHDLSVGDGSTHIYVSHSPGHPPDQAVPGWTPEVWQESNGLAGLQKVPTTINNVAYPADTRLVPGA